MMRTRKKACRRWSSSWKNGRGSIRRTRINVILNADRIPKSFDLLIEEGRIRDQRDRCNCESLRARGTGRLGRAAAFPL